MGRSKLPDVEFSHYRMLYRLLADAVVAIHFAFVAYLVVGLVLIVIGMVCRWPWIRNPWFRTTHLLGISVVVLEMVFGVWCPLTVWEDALRAKSGVPIAKTGFVERLLEKLLFETVPVPMLDAIYWMVGALILVLFLIVPPRWKQAQKTGAGG